MDATQANNLVAPISSLPPELLSQIFLLLLRENHYDDHLHICLVCKSWLPSARAALYRSVTLSAYEAFDFARTIEANQALAALVRHLTIHRTTISSEAGILKFLPVLSHHHETLQLLTLHASSIIEPEHHAEIVKSLPFLRHLAVDTCLFESIHAMKGFISSFVHPHRLDVNQELGGDSRDEWYTEATSGISSELPPAIRSLEFNLADWTTEVRPQRKYLFALPVNQDADHMKEHFSTVISTLSSQSLQTVRFDVRVRRPASPQDDFMDWGVLDEAAGNAHIWVTIQCSRKRKMKIAGTILYRSVTIYNSKIRVFTRSMEENEYLAPLIKHLALDRSNTRTDWLYINRILRVLSPHKALRSFHLPATTRISPKDIEVIQSVSLLSFLGHLDVDINIFSSLHAIKQFIASFPQIHTLDVNDEFGRDVEGEWFDESASDAPIEFPPSIRRL
ncbi:hypothetical protein ONZ45_g7253 [Pleurotus djamor]|nr:hypothetical protein ONZ45_g7253 [Pleurotus djamor]